MGISCKTDLEWGQTFYLKADNDQYEHHLVAVIFMPGSKHLKFRLSYMGDETEVWDFECTTERDPLKGFVDKDEEE